MNPIRKLFSKTSETFRNLIKRFPVTLAVILFATIFLTVGIDYNINLLEKVILFCTIFSIESFFTENIFYEKKSFKIISYCISAIVSLIFTLSILNDITIHTSSIIRILIGYLIILFLISIYKIIKDYNIKFQEYLLNVFANLFNGTITYIILNLGLTLIAIIFVELLLNSWGDILLRIQILLFGLFFIPTFINSVWNVKNREVNAFIQGLIKFVLLPLVSIAMLIIYMYIIKILVLRQIPSNVIFRILASIFIVAFPVWNMAWNFKNNSRFIEKLVNLLPLFYIPFIFLEIYSLFIRIADFGITPTRYFGILFIILQVIMLILNIVKKGEQLHHTFIYISILILVAFILPTNYNKVSILSQRNILVNAFSSDLSYEELSQENKAKVFGAYRYLVQHNAQEYIPEYVTQYKDDINSSYYSEYGSNKKYVYFNNTDKFIDITNYSKLVAVSGYGTRAQLELYSNTNEFIEILNCENLLHDIVNSQDPEIFLQSNSLLNIDNTKALYISSLRCSYNEDNGQLIYISVDGYMLYK